MSVINSKDWEKQSDMVITILYPAFFSEYCHFQDNQKNNLKSTEIKILIFLFSRLSYHFLSCFLNVAGLLYGGYENNTLNSFLLGLSGIALIASNSYLILVV